MPSYANSQPPIALAPGDVGFSFSSESVPSSATSGSQFALVYSPIGSQAGFSVRWQTIFTVAPTAIIATPIRSPVLRIVFFIYLHRLLQRLNCNRRAKHKVLINKI